MRFLFLNPLNRKNRPTARKLARPLSLSFLIALLFFVSACGITGNPTPYVILIPSTPAPTDTPGPTATPHPPLPNSYTVKPGDTLSSIAVKFGLSVDELVQANQLKDANHLAAGQVLVVPTPLPVTLTPKP